MTPCVRVKDGVKFDRISPAGFKMLAVIQNAAFVFDRDLTITCGTDSHPPTDPHTLGAGYDLSVRGMSDLQIIELAKYLKTQLGPNFTVLYETPIAPSSALSAVAFVNPGATAPHIHAQLRHGAAYPAAT